MDVPSLAATLRALVDRAADAGHVPRDLELCMENGRFLTGPYGWLVARCHAVKHAFGQHYAGLDACMANLMRPGMYNAYHGISVPAAAPDAPLAPVNVVGTLCENNDWFARARELPPIRVGDLVVIHETGAHAHSMGFQVSLRARTSRAVQWKAARARTAAARGRPRRPHVRGANARRRSRTREAAEDLLANVIVPKDLAPARPRLAPALALAAALLMALAARRQ